MEAVEGPIPGLEVPRGLTPHPQILEAHPLRVILMADLLQISVLRQWVPALEAILRWTLEGFILFHPLGVMVATPLADAPEELDLFHLFATMVVVPFQALAADPLLALVADPLLALAADPLLSASPELLDVVGNLGAVLREVGHGMAGEALNINSLSFYNSQCSA